MPISKVKSSSITTDAVGPTQLNEASNYSFTGTVTGAGEPNPLSLFARWDSSAFTHGGSASTLMTGWSQIHSSSAVLGHSSGTFSFPSTGYYLIQANCSMTTYPGSDARNLSLQIHTTSNNSSYSAVHSSQTHIRDVGDATHAGASFTFMEDVTDITNQKFRIYGYSATTPSNTTLQFSSIVMTVARLGDT